MKKITTLVLFIISIWQQLYAQTFNVAISEPVKFEVPGKVYKYGSNFIGFEEFDYRRKMTFGYKLREQLYKVRLSKYDAGMNRIKEFVLGNDDQVFGPFDTRIQLINKKLYLIYTTLEEAAESTIRIMAAEIDSNSLALLSPKELMAITKPEGASNKLSGLLSSYNLQIVKSPDQSKVLLAWTSGLTQDTYCTVTDANLNVLWNKKSSFSTIVEGELISSYIDNNGKAYMSVRTYNIAELYRLHVLVCQKDKTDNDILITLPEGKPYEGHLVSSADGSSLQLAGTYMPLNYKGQLLSGAFSLLVSTNNYSISKILQAPFTTEILEQLGQYAWGDTKEKKRGTDYLDMHAIALKNGNTVLLGEFSRVQSTEKGSVYISGDILVIQYNNGTIVFSRVPKIRVSAGSSMGSSFSAFTDGVSTYVLYNDKEKNLKKDLADEPARSDVYKDVVLVAATITDTQPIKREKIIDLQDDNFCALTDLITVIEPGVLMVPIQKIKAWGKRADLSRWGTLKILK